MANIVNDTDLMKKEKKLFVYVFITFFLLSSIFTFKIFFLQNTNVFHIEFTLQFIKIFNCVLSALAFLSCILSYKRLKKDSIYIISLTYLLLFIDIFLGNLDHLSFYSNDLTFTNYITISTSLMRFILLILAISPKNKLSNLILRNKNKSIILLSVSSIFFSHIEKYYNMSTLFNSYILFFSYNTLLLLTYLTVTFKVLYFAIKENEHFFLVIGSSLFILSVKATYIMYTSKFISLPVKITSVSITYLSSLIVIIGSFIELYIYLERINVLNNDYKIFFNIVENSKDTSILIQKEDGEILYANKKTKEYYSLRNDLHLTDLKFAIKNHSKHINTDKILDIVKKNGYWRGTLNNNQFNRTFDCSIELVNISGYENEFAVTFRDITEELFNESEISKLKIYDKAKSEFISNLSHELRTPLNIFYSTIQLLDSMSLNDDTAFRNLYKKYQSTLDLNCKRMLRLISNVIDISKIDAGLMETNFENYDIVSVVENVTLSVVDYALLKSITIQFDTSVEEHIIKCDAALIERVILNLLSNAIKFSDNNKNIYVNLSLTESLIQIEIKDEGIGVSDKLKKDIFKRFVQVDKSFNRMNEGSGLGLSIVQSIINLHNGSITLESKVNEGSTFKISLPNEHLDTHKFKIYNIDGQNIELELSDIYELMN